MTTLTHGNGRSSGSTIHPTTGLISAITERWREYRSLRALESMPFNVMKDVGYPAPAERKHAK